MESLSIVNVDYHYVDDPVLRGVSLRVAAGESIALMGPSGCGKSTMLLLAAGILTPVGGSIEVGGQVISDLASGSRAAMRRTSIGFVFQFSELISELSLLENVSLAAELAGMRRRSALDSARQILTTVGVSAVHDSKPGSVSGGQAQRAAIARAVVHQPRLVLADEPTGALDSNNGDRVLDLLTSLTRDQGSALVVATHDIDIAKRCDRIVEMKDGMIKGPDVTSS